MSARIVRLGVSIPLPLKRRIAREAARQGVSMSALVCQILQASFEKGTPCPHCGRPLPTWPARSERIHYEMSTAEAIAAGFISYDKPEDGERCD